MITVLSGANTHAISEKLAELKQAFIKKHGEGGVEVYDGQQLQSEQLHGLVAGITLFATERFVVIKNLSQNKALIEPFLSVVKLMTADIEIVMIENSLDKRTALYKMLKKEADFHELGELDESQLVEWIQTEVKRQKGTIGTQTARLLAQYVGLNQGRMLQEITKLVAYDPIITKQTITQLIDLSPQDTIFQLLEYALSGKSAAALKVLEGLEQAHEDPFQAASMLIWQTHILAVVHSGINTPDSAIAKSAKVNPFVVRKTRLLAQSMNRKRLRHIVDTVALCDVTLKTSSNDPWRVLEQTVLSL